MSEKIVILGWGSLIYELCNLKKNVQLPWQDGGPRLPIEFSRISESRNRALTLVIDPINGVIIPTQFIDSKRKDAKDAACDLRNREGTIICNIGIIDLKNGYENYHNEEIAKVVKLWLAEKGFRAAIWTDLPSNFKEISKIDFSIGAAIDHLNKLSKRGIEEAKAYIKNAPNYVDTPLRNKLKSIGWY
jgi:hypothetical protein